MHNVVIETGAISIAPEQLIEFQSQGRLLLIGSQLQLQSVLPYLSDLQLSIISDDKFEPGADIPVINETISHIEGWLGQFVIHTKTKNLHADLILDLSSPRILTTKVPPLGYFAPEQDAQQLAEALQQLPDMVGIFDKPKFFNYKSSICAHSRRGIVACNQCIDACPAEAIRAEGELIAVNPSLCQGCGSCTVVCPSGAISYALPTLDVSLDRLRKMINHYFELELTPPRILIHDEGQAQQILADMGEQLGSQVIPFSIEEIGALGMDFWLSALAYGAGSVTIWNVGSHPEHDWQELQQLIGQTNHLLQGLGYQDRLVSWIESQQIADLVAHFHGLPPVNHIYRPAQFAGLDDKRRVITMALSYMHQQAPAAVSELTLASPAAFGDIHIDKDACTLCLSCVAVCPMGALVDGVDKPQLNFIEDLCVQCGMCDRACPEDAVTLSPRYLFNREQARQKRVLYEEPVFHCIRCHKPFATQKMIDTMIERLKGHAMFQGAALERLKMCEDCRVKAMFEDPQGRK